MKRVLLAIIYAVGLAGSLVFRFMQVTKMTDPETGFLYTQYESSKYAIYGICGAFALLLLLLGLFGDGLPNLSDKSAVFGVFSIIMGLVGLAVVYSLAVDFKIELGIIAYIIFAMLFSVYMVYFGICKITGKAIVPLTATVPVIFSGIRLVIIFLECYGLAKTVDIVLEIIMLIVSMLFWHYFAKYTVNIKPKSTPRWLSGFALSASLLCFTVTVPTYYNIIFNKNAVHLVNSTSYFDLATGIYIIIFIITTLASSRRENAAK